MEKLQLENLERLLAYFRKIAETLDRTDYAANMDSSNHPAYTIGWAKGVTSVAQIETESMLKYTKWYYEQLENPNKEQSK